MLPARRFSLLVLALVSFVVVAAQASGPASGGPDGRPAAGSPWLASAALDGVAYFVFTDPRPRVERYDMTHPAWLESVPLTERPTAFAVAPDGLYLTYGRRLVRRTLDGSDEAQLFAATSDITEMVALHGHVVIADTEGPEPMNTLRSIDAATGVEADSVYVSAVSGLVAAQRIRRIFWADPLASAGVAYVDIQTDGSFGEPVAKEIQNWPAQQRLFMGPRETCVITDGGLLFAADDLEYFGAVGPGVDAVAVTGGPLVVLRDGELILVGGRGNSELARSRIDPRPWSIHARDRVVFAFVADVLERGVAATAPVDVNAIRPPAAAPIVDPTGLRYPPDAVSLDGEGILYLLSRTHRNVFRWSVSDRRYVESIPLRGEPLFMALGEDPRRLYLVYATGAITDVPLFGQFAEEGFAIAPEEPLGLAVAGQHLFVCDGIGSLTTHLTHSSADGTCVSMSSSRLASREHVWSPATRRIYFRNDEVWSPSLRAEPIDAGGRIGEETRSPSPDEVAIRYPIRVAPDGSVVVLGSGSLYDARSLAPVGALANTVDDAAWSGGDLFTLRAAAGGSEVQAWGADRGLAGGRVLGDTPIRLFGVSEGLLFVGLRNGAPSFTILRADRSLEVIYDAATEPPPNDDMRAFKTIDALPYSDTVVTTTATDEPGEKVASCAAAPEQAVWYLYFAESDGLLEFDATGSDFATALSVWVNEAPPLIAPHALREVACASGTGPADPARLVLRATEREYYLIKAGGTNGASGTLVLRARVPGAPNDDLADAWVIDRLPFELTMDIGTAGREALEAVASCEQSVRSRTVWFRYAPAVDERLRIDATDSEFYDPLVSVWQGDAHPLREVGCADGEPLTVDVRGGATYALQVGSPADEPGELRLRVTSVPMPPRNDDLASAVQIEALPFRDSVGTVEATDEPGERSGCSSGLRGVWYRYEPPMRQTLVLETLGSDYDTVLSVWTGSEYPLKRVACNDEPEDGGRGESLGWSRVVVEVNPAFQYAIKVEGYEGEAGNLVLTAGLAVPPANDDLADAHVIAAPGFHGDVSTRLATDEAGEAVAPCAPFPARGVWYRYTPDETGPYRIDTRGSRFDTVLSVWLGQAHPLSAVACNDDASGDVPWSGLLLELDAGTTYAFKVDGYDGRWGYAELNVTPADLGEGVFLPIALSPR